MNGLPALVGTGEIASLLGVHRSRADQLSRQVGFPLPVASFSGKRAWSLDDVLQWAEANGEKTVAVWYYGSDPAVNTPPFTRAFLSHLPHDGSDAGVRKWCGRAKYLAVSVGCLHGHADVTASHRLALEWARRHEPVARTTYFAIYRLP